MTDRIGWGIVGLGSRAREAALPALLASPRIKVVAVCGRDEAKTRAAAASWPELEVAASIDGLVQSPEVQVVYIATPHFLHVPQAVKAIEAGKHVFMESPLSLSVDGAHKLVEKARSMRVRLGVAFNYRFHAAVGRIKGLIDGGELGEVRRVAVSVADPAEIGPGWWSDAQRTGPAALLRLGVHAVDLAIWLRGVELAEVMAMGGDDEKADRDRICSILFRYKDGVIGQVTGAIADADLNHVILVEGAKGRARFEGDLTGANPGALALTRAGQTVIEDFEPDDPVGRMVDEFSAAIQEDRAFLPDGRQGKAVVEVTCAVIDAIKQKRAAKVGEVQRQV